MGQYVKTVDELATRVGISRQELQSTWIKRPGWPPKTSHGWDVEACQTYKIKEYKERAANTHGVNSDVKRRILTANAEIAEMEVAKEKGALLPVDDVCRLFSHAMGKVKSGLERYVSVIASETGDARMTQLAERARDSMLTELSKALNDYPRKHY